MIYLPIVLLVQAQTSDSKHFGILSESIAVKCRDTRAALNKSYWLDVSFSLQSINLYNYGIR